MSEQIRVRVIDKSGKTVPETDHRVWSQSATLDLNIADVLHRVDENNQLTVKAVQITRLDGSRLVYERSD